MAAAAYFGRISPSDFEDMEVEVVGAVMERIMRYVNEDAKAKGDLVQAQTEAITNTIAAAAQGIAKSTGQAVMAVGKAVLQSRG